MSDTKPTDADWAKTADTLDWYKQYLEKHEPQAQNDIFALEVLLESIPTSSASLKDL